MFSSNAAVIEQVLSQFDVSINLSLNEQVRHLVNDTRDVNAGDIFCAVNGTAQKGRAYIADALAKNCDLILVECDSANEHAQSSEQFNALGNSVAIIEFYQLNQQLFELAKAFYQAPQNALTMIGITGTNGKTSTSQMIAQLLDTSGKSCSVIGTNGAGKVAQLSPINNTTPGASQLHQLLQEFREAQQSHIAMEVSSHALAQGRVTASLFDTAIFTNLTRDHLDYHQTMENYAQAKYQIFTQTAAQIAIVNGDDEQAKRWLSVWSKNQSVLVYGRSNSVTDFDLFVQAKAIKHLPQGVEFQLHTHLGDISINSKIMGDFNIDNLLAAISVLLIEKVSLSDIAKAVQSLTPVIGRMEAFVGANKPVAIVDYAHTPDALENALQACRQHCHGALWLVFGCGGDRDKGKRPLMGRIAEANSDHIIVTNDNPRTESAENIAQDILAGCQQPEKITVLLERQQAVMSALNKAKKEDVVLLAGKGHEDYIIMGDQHIPYNERALVRSFYAHGAAS
ncbi:UDP-N-acetylmuramoyl-L-alanyl-D-glutamate--2,6-diaminopimelate ligase [Colwellia sp. 1_MG-2023]|uniref:UDP-N-acetylmuramoyl-L-alanyl-D-glutamate--2, 6-diaminopimelate ligase n=1 Tax=Colwellia sp. 1_MG-2023 TaxID=3062649 RepID=UPI0026E4703C|nr:UDP-N-acetylmuramoyl-L-alanyl-D-glutamate--2,6-diaminopimelate ligase [Colwellia sp. 1_MG-2023]MDO6444684.1 UDP-N-acetylmuramoyl-L-alanyl-D-glutamate--2,6-diaminopimelate ligase [Colwellia sp. 1_MG-2023]